MKSFLYFVFGVICALFACIATFNNYFEIYLDDYYVDLLYNEYNKEWYYVTLISSTIFIFSVIAWVYSLGKSANELSKEPLISKTNE